MLDLDITKDIRSLTDFKRNTPEFLVSLKGSGRAVVLTVNGHAEVAVMSAGTFQKVIEALDALEAIRGVREGMKQMAQGKGRPADEFFSSMRKKHNSSKKT